MFTDNETRNLFVRALFTINNRKYTEFALIIRILPRYASKSVSCSKYLMIKNQVICLLYSLPINYKYVRFDQAAS